MINPKTEELSYQLDGEGRGYWIFATGTRGERSADPGPYARKVAWVNSKEAAQKEIELMIKFSPGEYTRGEQ